LVGVITKLVKIAPRRRDRKHRSRSNLAWLVERLTAPEFQN